MINNDSYFDKLKSIPHLNLTPYLKTVDLESMINDINQFEENDFYPYDAADDNKNFKEFLSKNWTGCSLIDTVKTGKQFADYYSSDSFNENLEFNLDDNGNPIYKPTDIGLKCSSILNYIYEIIKSPQRTRLSRLPIKSHIHWHSHKILSEYGPTKKFSSGLNSSLVIHIVLKTNSRCWMGVSTQHPSGKFPFKIHKQHYSLGEVWILNGHYYHNVFNGGDTTRDHIYLHASMYDEKLKPIIEKALDNYDGITIKDPIVPQRFVGSLNLNLETGLPI